MFPLIFEKVKGRIAGLWFLISIPSVFLGHKLREHGPVLVRFPARLGRRTQNRVVESGCAHVSRNQASPVRGVTEVYSQIKAQKLSSYCS